MDFARHRAATARTRHFAAALAVAALAALAFASVAAAAWTREAAPGLGAVFQSNSSMSVLPDGSVRYIAATGKSPSYTNQLVVRPPAGSVAFAAPFPAAFGQNTSDNILSLSPPDASGNQLVIRGASPFGVAFLAPGGDPAGVAPAATTQITAIDLAPSGEAAAIVSDNSEASVAFRPAGAAAVFDTPRTLDRAGKMRSYGIGITIDPDGGVLVVYRTEQPDSAILQSYAPPGGNFGTPQLLDVAKADINTVTYGQSTNGRAILAWDEDTGGDTNSEKVWSLTRAPGGLLGDKSLVATSRPDGIISASKAAITDDGSSYVSVLDSGPVACGNGTREGGGVLVRRAAGSSSWERLNPPPSGNGRSDIEGISTAGNAVGVLTVRLAYPVNFCTDYDPASSVEVQLGSGASLGAAQTIASEGITSGNKLSTIVRPRGFAVNAGGAAAVLINEPQDAANNSSPFLYSQGGSTPPPPVPSKPLPAPGKIKLSGAKLTARGGETDFLASCTRLPGEGSKLFCSVGALLLLEKRSAGASAKAKKKAKLQVIATAKTVKVPVGKTKKVTLKLNKLGKKKLAAAKKAGLKVTLKVTIKRKGYATNTIEKKTKLVAGKAKPKGKGKAKKK